MKLNDILRLLDDCSTDASFVIVYTGNELHQIRLTTNFGADFVLPDCYMLRSQAEQDIKLLKFAYKLGKRMQARQVRHRLKSIAGA